MGRLLEELWESIKEGLIEAITGRLAGLFDMINETVGDIAENVGLTPSQWNSNIFAMIRNLSETAVIPIAGMILTFVLCYELIQLIIEKNNMHEFDTFNIYKWIFKTFVAVFILTNTFTIVLAIFELAQQVVSSSTGVITGSLEVGSADAMVNLEATLREMGVWELIGLFLEIFIIDLCLAALTIVIFVIIFGRMIEIYLVVSIAPIPLATMINREWGQIGNNYIKSLFALAFQGFLIMVCVGIYAVLVQTIPAADSIHAALWRVLGYTVLLCFALFKTGSLSKSLFTAH